MFKIISLFFFKAGSDVRFIGWLMACLALIAVFCWLSYDMVYLTGDFSTIMYAPTAACHKDLRHATCNMHYVAPLVEPHWEFSAGHALFSGSPRADPRPAGCIVHAGMTTPTSH
jgi:hypothetical protein